ncbi:cobalamin B12-binding domain-containing protein [Mesorhizobium sp. 1B3]|uniref:cobalamin B12-binding domain-containing protein n=1 Tax=Mesorhizobium sp. 1B3 TaxID=3243599 RepID=UPI003D96B59C
MMQTFPAIEPFRFAAPFETLRAQSERLAAARGVVPRIFMATLGSAASFTARATFAKNFFEAAGIEAPIGDGYICNGDTDMNTLTAAFKRSDCSVVCICGSDNDYWSVPDEAVHTDDTLVEQVARTLKREGAALVALAGKPGTREIALQQSGIDQFIFAGCDVAHVLEQCIECIG